MTTAVRASQHAHQLLKALADERGVSITEALDAVVEAYEQSRMRQAFHAGYARLRSDEEAWQQECEQRRLWDQALNDGLERFDAA